MLISGVQEGGKEIRTFSLEHTHAKGVLCERLVMTGLYFPIRVATRLEIAEMNQTENLTSSYWLFWTM